MFFRTREEAINEHYEDSPPSQNLNATDAPCRPLTLKTSGLVIDPKNYTEPYAARSKNGEPTTNEHPVANPAAIASPHHNPNTSHTAATYPRISMVELVLNNVTYDAILAASAKSLRLEVASGVAELPPLPSAPPNTPTSTDMNYGCRV